MRDGDIIELIRRRDEAGLHALLTRYSPLMRYVASPILKSEGDVEECISEAAMKVWNNIGSYSPEKGSFSAYLTAIVRNTALNRIRGREQTPSPLTEDMTSSEPTPEERVLASERRDALKRAIDSLSESDRRLFYRKYYYMQSTAQIASETGLTERAVEGRLYRLRQRLRRKMGGDGFGR